MMTKSKAAGNYINSVLAKHEVKKAGYDEAIMLDAEGYVSEASGENIFIVRDRKVHFGPIDPRASRTTAAATRAVTRDLSQHCALGVSVAG